jgi:hypothetical protein
MRLRLLLVAALALVAVNMAFADIPQLNLQVGANPVTNVVGSGNSASYNNTNFFGWNLMVVFGNSNSPGLVPYGLDITSLSAACVGGGSCGTLTIDLSDTGFTTASPSFRTFYSSTQTGGAASTTQTAWDDPNNLMFGTTNLIGTVGPITGAGGSGTASGGGPEVGGATHPYSLTIQDVFTGCSGENCVSYSTDGNITGVPEPAAVVLFGSVLALCASKFRRRRAA